MQAMFCLHLYLEFRGCFLPLLSLRPCTSCCPSSVPCCAMHSAPCRVPPQQGPGQGNLLLPVWHSCSVHKNTFLLFHSTVGKKKSWVPSTCNYLWWYLKAMSKVNTVGLQTALVPWHKMAFRSQSCENQISWLTATAPVAFCSVCVSSVCRDFEARGASLGVCLMQTWGALLAQHGRRLSTTAAAGRSCCFPSLPVIHTPQPHSNCLSLAAAGAAWSYSWQSNNKTKDVCEPGSFPNLVIPCIGAELILLLINFFFCSFAVF